MVTLSCLLRYSTWPTKCCKEYYEHSVLIFARLSQHFSRLFSFSFRAFSKHVKLCFKPLSGFVIPHVKMLEEGRGMGGGILCPCVRLFVCLSAGFVQKISSEQFILLYPNLIWWCIVRRRCHAQELGCYLRGQGHNKGLYNHNMPVSTISSELKGVLLFFATELSLLVENVLLLCKRSWLQ